MTKTVVDEQVRRAVVGEFLGWLRGINADLYCSGGDGRVNYTVDDSDGEDEVLAVYLDAVRTDAENLETLRATDYQQLLEDFVSHCEDRYVKLCEQHVDWATGEHAHYQAAEWGAVQDLYAGFFRNHPVWSRHYRAGGLR